MCPMFKPNEGTADRIIRLVLGIILIAAGVFVLGGVLKIVALVVGIVMLFTAATGFCLPYRLLNISTKK